MQQLLYLRLPPFLFLLLYAGLVCDISFPLSRITFLKFELTLLYSLTICCAVLSCLVVSDSFQPHGLYPARFLSP